LIGRVVKNEGTIRAPEGKISLSVGNEILLQTDEQPMILIRSSIVGEEIEGAALSHSGVLEAFQIELKSGSSIYQKAIQCSGIIDAIAVRESAGMIELFAPEKECMVEGTLRAIHSELSGGKIHILGEQIHMHGNALIDVSGETGGGEILLGGDYQGKNSKIPNAKNAYVDGDVILRADALDRGDGGKIIVWSDGFTSLLGKISVRGGLNGGDGGFAEVSGKTDFIYRGFTDAQAPFGKAGTLLLDPTDIRISTFATSGSFSGCGSPPSTYIKTGATFDELNNVDLANQLQNCNVIVQTTSTGGPGTGSIDVLASVTWTTANNLTLDAYSRITTNAGTAFTNTAFSATPFTALTLLGRGSVNNTSNILFGDITTNDGSVYISTNASTSTINLFNIHLSGSITVNGSGNITFEDCIGTAPSNRTMAGILIDAGGLFSSTGSIIFSNIRAAGNVAGPGNGISLSNASIIAPIISATNIFGAGVVTSYVAFLMGANAVIGSTSNQSITISATAVSTFSSVSNSCGIQMSSGTSSIITGDGGSIYLRGVGGGGGTGGTNIGTFLQSGTIQVGNTVGGTLTIEGTGGGGSGTNNTGATLSCTFDLKSGTTVNIQNCFGGGGTVATGVQVSSNLQVGTDGSTGSIIFGGSSLTPIRAGGSGGSGVNINALISAGIVRMNNISSPAGHGIFTSGATLGGAFNQIFEMDAMGGVSGPFVGFSGIALNDAITTGVAGTITLHGVASAATSGIAYVGASIVGIITGTGSNVHISGTGGGGASTPAAANGVNLGGTWTMGAGTNVYLQNIQAGGGSNSIGLSIAANIIIPNGGVGNEGSITIGGTGTPVSAGTIGSGTRTGVNLRNTLSAQTITISNVTGSSSVNSTASVGLSLITNGVIGDSTLPQNISISASGGGAGGSGNVGVNLTTSVNRIQTGSGGSLVINGTGGGSATNEVGVRVAGGAIIRALGTGTLSVTGTGSSTGTAGSYGIYVTGAGSAISAVDADLNLTGQSFIAPFYGIVLDATTTANVSTTGAGSIIFSTPSSFTSLNSANNPVISSGHNLTFNNGVILNAATSVLNTSTNNGNILFSGTVDGATAGTQSLSMIPGTGTITFSQAVGGTVPLAALPIAATSSGLFIANNITAASLTVSGTVPTTFTGASVINTSATPGPISFGGTVNGAVGLIANAGTSTVTFTGSLGGTTPLTSLNVIGNLINTNANQTTNGPMIYTGAVTASSSATFTNLGSGGIFFSSTLTGNDTSLILSALNTTIQVVGDITTTGSGSGINGKNFTATASGNITLASIFAKGGPGGLSSSGGNIHVSSSQATVEVGDIDTSGVSGGNGGAIDLQPGSGLTSTSLGDIPNGFLILDGDLIALGAAGGAITLSGSGRSSLPSIASIVSSFVGNDVTIRGASLTLGSLEAFTVFGNLTIDVTGSIFAADLVAVENITLIGSSLTLPSRGPALLLNVNGFLVTSHLPHIIAGNDVINLAGSTNLNNGVIQSSHLGLGNSFRTSLVYTPNSYILNYGENAVMDDALIAEIARSISILTIASTQEETYLPDPWHRSFSPTWEEQWLFEKKLVEPIEEPNFRNWNRIKGL
jgi:hypothetical protein